VLGHWRLNNGRELMVFANLGTEVISFEPPVGFQSIAASDSAPLSQSRATVTIAWMTSP
jgi:hypothetical protein